MMKRLTERRKTSLAFLFPSSYNNNNTDNLNNNVEGLGPVYEKNPGSRRKTSVQPVSAAPKTPPSTTGSRRSSLSFLFSGDESAHSRSKSRLSLSSLSLAEKSDEEDYLCTDLPSSSSSTSPPPPPSKPVRRNRSILRHTSTTDRPDICIPQSDAPRWMGRAMRVIVAGAKKCGKTAILRQVACLEDVTKMPYQPTMDDTYQVLLEECDRPREILVFHDTAGIPEYGPVELRRPYIQVADAFVLVYSVIDHESFNRMDLLKKFIEKQFGKDKKEVPIVVLGTMCDLPGRKVDFEFAQNWAHRERVRLFEVTSVDRTTLVEFVHYVGQRHFHPQKESLKFSLSKKLKSEKSNAAILMDF